MATTLSSPGHAGAAPRGRAQSSSETWHYLRLGLAWATVIALILILAWYGASYYRLNLEDRPSSPLHASLRPSGTIGLRIGMLGTAMFCVLFLYPLRKAWKWLGRKGKTKHWLDFHVLIGISAPVLITFHASFKLNGLIGIAYWIMLAVALSGFIGRYIYSQIPRSINAVQLSIGELETEARELAESLHQQKVFEFAEIAPLLEVPTPKEVKQMSLGALFASLIRMDLKRPLLVSRLRRRVLTGTEIVTTLGGLRRSSHYELEGVISAIRGMSWLHSKMTFLDRTQQVFHLWHVIHRPFSYSFAVIVLIHIGIAISLGYF
jgi:hypothetical protein